MQHDESRGLAWPRLTKLLAWYGWVGCGLVAVFWPLNWLLPGFRTHLLFFPLWLGYALVIDALVLRRTSTSLITRSPRGFAMLFVLSVPGWWVFEVLNWRTGNWEYVGRNAFTDLEFLFYGSLSFSTVMPAVFGTAELVGSFAWLRRFADGPRVSLSVRKCVAWFAAGAAMLVLLLVWPTYFFPFMWLSGFFLLDPVCVWLGRPAILRSLAWGNWRPVIALALGTLICGFFWELWNFYSFPKWIYHVPFVGFLHVFEMPLLGYLGYPAFGLELYALANLLRGKRSTPGI